MPRSTEKPNTTSPTDIGSQLKRNRACYQCRKRKVKCDALRPVCTACLRAIRYAADPTSVPNECTYDEPIEFIEELKSENERLKARNHELESMMMSATQAIEQSNQSLRPDPTTIPPTTQPSEDETTLSHLLLALASSAPLPPQPQSRSLPLFDGAMLGNFEVPNSYFNSPAPPAISNPHSSHNTDPIAPPNSHFPAPSSPDPFLELLYPAWPSHLPAPDLLLHLVDVFFASHPHALYILHRPSFLTRLNSPPSSPEFPHRSVLHAISAVGSLYSLRMAGPSKPDFLRLPRPVLTMDKYKTALSKLVRPRDHSFGEKQAELSNKAREETMITGERLLELSQSHVILNWWYYAYGDWIEYWDGCSRSLRNTVALQLNASGPFTSLSTFTRGVFPIIKPGEEEVGINVFWLAYLGERQHGVASRFPASLDDDDVSQVLPLTYEDFEAQVIASEGERQRISNPKALTTHPAEHTDSFILYVKSFVLLSRIKSWCCRAKARYPTATDYRETPEFKALDSLITSFAISFPKRYRDPLRLGPQGRAVDVHLFTAHCVPHIAKISLHMPVANLYDDNDMSAQKSITAARAILELIFSLTSTSFDFSMLDPMCAYIWTAAGRVLAGYMRKQISRGDIDEAKVVMAQLEVIQLALNRFGERIPLAYRQATMLADELDVPVDGQNPRNLCGTSSRSWTTPFGMSEVPLMSWESVLQNGVSGEGDSGSPTLAGDGSSSGVGVVDTPIE